MSSLGDGGPIAALVESGRIADLVIAFLVLEGVALWLWRRRQGLPARDLLSLLLPGLCLALALRAALTGSGWIWVALWLALSLPAHLFDVKQRLRPQARVGPSRHRSSKAE